MIGDIAIVFAAMCSAVCMFCFSLWVCRSLRDMDRLIEIGSIEAEPDVPTKP